MVEESTMQLMLCCFLCQCLDIGLKNAMMKRWAFWFSFFTLKGKWAESKGNLNNVSSANSEEHCALSVIWSKVLRARKLFWLVRKCSLQDTWCRLAWQNVNRISGSRCSPSRLSGSCFLFGKNVTYFFFTVISHWRLIIGKLVHKSCSLSC